MSRPRVRIYTPVVRMASLPKSVISTIKATAPMVGPHATKITSCFYQKLFRNDPDNLRYFNKTNQVNIERAPTVIICE